MCHKLSWYQWPLHQTKLIKMERLFGLTPRNPVKILHKYLYSRHVPVYILFTKCLFYGTLMLLAKIRVTFDSRVGTCEIGVDSWPATGPKLLMCWFLKEFLEPLIRFKTAIVFFFFLPWGIFYSLNLYWTIASTPLTQKRRLLFSVVFD